MTGPHDCGCVCCTRWSTAYADLAPSLAQAALAVIEELLTDPALVTEGRIASVVHEED